MPCFDPNRNANHPIRFRALHLMSSLRHCHSGASAVVDGKIMISTLKAALLPTFVRGAASSRETLRRSLARDRQANKDEIEQPRLVLASASPRRVTLLAQVGVTPDALRPASIDETAKKGEVPRSLVARLARSKAETARDQVANDRDLADAYILAADTVVAVGRKILVKPSHVEEAMASLQLLSGRTHKVQTCICLITPDDRVRTKIVDTRVRFKHLTTSEIESYIASREWRGKAGGYAIQGLAGCFVQRIIGSYTNVVGLPLTEVTSLLNSEGFPIHYNWLKYAEVDRE
jgi:septum formation protein